MNNYSILADKAIAALRDSGRTTEELASIHADILRNRSCLDFKANKLTIYLPEVVFDAGRESFVSYGHVLSNQIKAVVPFFDDVDVSSYNKDASDIILLPNLSQRTTMDLSGLPGGYNAGPARFYCSIEILDFPEWVRYFIFSTVNRRGVDGVPSRIQDIVAVEIADVLASFLDKVWLLRFFEKDV